MTGLNHAATGALVAVVIKQPAIALPLALLSHFVSDALPHWKYHLPLKVKRIFLFSDSLLSLVLLAVVSIVYTAPAWLVFSCGLLAILPDAMWLPQVVLTGSFKQQGSRSSVLYHLRYVHAKLQWCEPEKNGWYLELAWLVVIIALIILFGKK